MEKDQKTKPPTWDHDVVAGRPYRWTGPTIGLVLPGPGWRVQAEARKPDHVVDRFRGVAAKSFLLGAGLGLFLGAVFVACAWVWL